jgi:uncharacterized protein YecE (DUF72 family)
MDFGRLPSIEGVSFALPPDPPQNARVLSGRRIPAPRIVVGCPSWNHPEWIGKVYRPGPKSREFLAEYAQQFSGIEVNATAYNMPAEQKIAQWRDAAPPDFRYCIKLPQTITHYGAPTKKLELAREFAQRIAPLGDQLGPPLLQFSERFGTKQLDDLDQFLRAYAGEVGPAVELRHPDFFVGAGLEWLDRLAALGLPAVITDTAGRRDVVHMRLTAPRTFIRFTGNNLHPTDYSRIDAWAERIADWIEQGLEEVYFFVHTSPKLNCPELANYASAAFARRVGIVLKQWTPPSTDSATLFAADASEPKPKAKPRKR